MTGPHSNPPEVAASIARLQQLRDRLAAAERRLDEALHNSRTASLRFGLVGKSLAPRNIDARTER